MNSQSTYEFEFSLRTPKFENGVADQVVYIEMKDTKIWGWIEVSITGSYNHQLTTGKLTKRYAIGHNLDNEDGLKGHFSQTTDISEAFGPIADQWYIGDFDNENDRIPIYHLVSTGNTLTVTIKGVTVSASLAADLESNIKFSAISTESFSGINNKSIMQDRVGIGTKDPNEKLSISDGNIELATTNAQMEEDSEINSIDFSYRHPSYTQSKIAKIAAKNYNTSGTGWYNFLDRYNAGLSFYTTEGNTLKESLTITNEGKVGIGTTTPQERLTIKDGNIHIENEQVAKITSSDHNMTFSGVDEKYCHRIYTFRPAWGTSGTTNTRIKLQNANTSGAFTDAVLIHSEGNSYFNGGNVGIGTETPQTKLDINGDLVVDNESHTNTSIRLGHRSNTRIFADNTTERHYGGGMFFRVPDGDHETDYIDALMISDEGKIGINTKKFGDYHLSVAGKVRATEIVVSEVKDWADFVFDDDYELLSLQEVEAHINEKGHLPSIPSAKEVGEEGINLGEMDAKLLQKIEELTLYMIAQQKQIEELKAKIK